MTINTIPEKDEDEEDKEKKEETEDERKKRIGFPSYDIEELFEELNIESQYPKLKEHEIDAELFWELGDGEINDMCEIKVVGQQRKLKKRMEEIKKEHEKAMEEKHTESKKLNTDGIKFMLNK